MLLRGRRRAEGPATDTIELVRAICESALLPNAFQIGKREVSMQNASRASPHDLLGVPALRAARAAPVGLDRHQGRDCNRAAVQILALPLASQTVSAASHARHYAPSHVASARGHKVVRGPSALYTQTSGFILWHHIALAIRCVTQANRRCKTLSRLYARKQAAAIRLHAIARGFATRQYALVIHCSNMTHMT